MNKREQRRRLVSGVIQKLGINREDLAEMLHVSKHTVVAWLKPVTSESSNPIPDNAIILLAYKLKFKNPRRHEKDDLKFALKVLYTKI